MKKGEAGRIRVRGLQVKKSVFWVLEEGIKGEEKRCEGGKASGVKREE